MKEYAFEGGGPVDLEKLKAGFMSEEDYSKAHAGLPIICHDVLIEYKGGLLLVVRDNLPFKGELCPIGGRVKRGVPLIESLKDKVRAECNLELTDIKEVAHSRQFWETDPFGHGKGTDTFSFMFVAKGEGELKLDELHKQPMIVKPSEYGGDFRKRLHPFVRDFMDLAMPLIESLPQ